ncbi:hypothetical protein CR513_41888, partial [Mucuna pruriens]
MEGERKGNGTGSEETEPWHKPKNGSVFPAKRRSVKRMMYEQVTKAMNKKSSKTVSPAPEPSKSKQGGEISIYVSILLRKRIGVGVVLSDGN